MNDRDYLSDDGLLRLMESTEANPLCRAPGYLKEKILREAERQGKPKSQAERRIARTGMEHTPPQAAEIPQPQRTPAHDARKRQLLIFSAKVVAAAAAAIALLVAAPEAPQLMRPGGLPAIGREIPVQKNREDSLLDWFNQKSNRLCYRIMDTANSIFPAGADEE